MCATACLQPDPRDQRPCHHIPELATELPFPAIVSGLALSLVFLSVPETLVEQDVSDGVPGLVEPYEPFGDKDIGTRFRIFVRSSAHAQTATLSKKVNNYGPRPRRIDFVSLRGAKHQSFQRLPIIIISSSALGHPAVVTASAIVAISTLISR
ncbi:hypothetical protein LY76DRAFT_597648 [Colletotrichum caudatum]|nr:hypothetical protein LY76DRAFT_597648 [Colletotrichum caudatum]